MKLIRSCHSENDTQQLASDIASHISSGVTFYLNGDLGAGKTSFCRSFIQSLGVSGRVKSPTYTLVEPYEIDSWRIFHFDLYRLADPEELEFIGIRDYFQDDCICLIEWPEKGQGLLAAADLQINIDFCDSGRTIELVSASDEGNALLEKLNTA